MTQEKSPKNQEVLARFTVSDEKVGEYLLRIKKLEDLNAKDAIPEALKETKGQELNDVLDTLNEAIEERRGVYFKLKNKENPSTAELNLMEEIEFVLNEVVTMGTYHEHKKEDEGTEEIEAVKEGGKLEEKTSPEEVQQGEVVPEKEEVKNTEEKVEVEEDKQETKEEVVTNIDTPQEDTVTEKEEIKKEETIDEEPSEELKAYRYTSIIPKIRDFENKIKKGLTAELKDKILKFISNNQTKITYRKSVMDSDKVLDIGNKEYLGIEKALSQLEKLKTLVESTLVGDKVVEEQAEAPAEVQDKKVEEGNKDEKIKDPEEAPVLKKEVGRLNELDSKSYPEGEFENEEFTSYESIIQSIIKNKNPNARGIFLGEHKIIIRDLSNKVESIRAEEGDEALNSFITEQQENINSLIKLLKEKGSFNKEENSLLLNAIRGDFNFLEQKRVLIKKVPKKETSKEPEKEESTKEEKKSVEKEEKNEEKGETTDSDFTPIHLATELTLEKMAILKTNPDLFNEIMDTVDLYNEQINKKAPKKIIFKTLQRINNLKEASRNYVADFKKNGGIRDTSKKKAGGFKTSSDNNEDFDVVEKYATKAKSKKEAPATATPEVAKPVPATPEATPEETKEEEIRIFYTEEGNDYHEISNDKKFDFWLNNIEKSILKNGNSVESEIKSLDDWYKEYQEALPYMEKLEKIFNNIQEKAGGEKIIQIAAKEKIVDLLYVIHTEGKAGKDKIDTIFADYQKSIKLSKQKLELEKARDLAVKMKKERTRGEEERELTSNQVKSMLESRGGKNTEKNIDDMVDFLQDMQRNYATHYANKNEKVTDDMEGVYSRYKSSGKNKTGSKMGLGKRFLSSAWGAVADMFKSSDPVDYQNVKDLIVKTRDLNLVDRKTGNKDKARENEDRMEKLISFTRGQTELLIEHVQNPSSNKAETLDEEQKEMLKLFDAMYKTFTTSRYRGKEARAEAEELLKTNIEELEGDEMSETDILKNVPEVYEMGNLFEGDYAEYKTFQNEARLQVTKEDLVKLKKDLTKFPKTGKNITEWTKINNKFTEIKTTLEELGEDTENDLDLKTARLQLEELDIRHINKDVYKDLSKNFIKYENIINSTERTVEVKKTYIKDLLEALKKHRANKTNTKIQNGVLDDTIKRYEQVLKDIK